MSISKVKLFAGLLMGCLGFSQAATLTWTGGAGNNLWCDAGNWNAGGAAVDFAVENDYVFNDLPDGTVLTVTSGSTVKIKSLTLAVETVANATWKFTGTANIRYTGNGALVVPSGCTLNLDLAASNPWSGNGENGYRLSGGGTLRHTKSWTTWCGTVYVKESTLILKYAGSMTDGFGYSSVRLDDDAATLRLEVNAFVGRVYALGGAKPTIDLNGFRLCNAFGATREPISWPGSFMGTGASTLLLMGQSNWTFANEPEMGGVYEIRNVWCNLGSATAPVSLPVTSAVRMAGGGKLQLNENQTLSVIHGTASTGRIAIPEGKTLTVTGTNGVVTTSTYSARLVGGGGFTKAGADYTLTLTGDNSYTGATTVAAGTLELKREDRLPADLAYYFPLNGTTWLKDVVGGDVLDKSTYALPSTCAGISAGGACFATNVAGEVVKQRLRLESTKTKRLDVTSYTVSLWCRPQAGQKEGVLFTWGGGWNGGDQAKEICFLSVRGDRLVSGYGMPEARLPESLSLADGAWHHVAFTQEETRKTIWIDGVKRGEMNVPQGCATTRNDFQFGGQDGWGSYQGDLDEVMLANGVWNETRIRHEALRCREAQTLPNLPEPIAKWTFDEDFTDSVGGLVLVSRGTKTPTIGAREGAYGKCLNLNEAGRYLGLAADAKFPENFPTGRLPFTVSIRYMQNCAEYRHAFGWGDTATANAFFAVGINGAPRRNAFNWSNLGNGLTWALSDQATSSRLTAECWEHIVVTYDGTTLTAYRDGAAVETKTATLKLKPQDLFFGYRPNVNYQCQCYIDDVRVWNTALSADQVRAVARSLEMGEVGPTLPRHSDVAVAEGATLRTVGPGHVVKSLAGAGTVEVTAFSSLEVGNVSAFTGSFVGDGTLIVTGNVDFAQTTAEEFTGCLAVRDGQPTLNPTFAGGYVSVLSGGGVMNAAQNVEVAEGYTVVTDKTGSNLPRISTTGTISIPAVGKVVFSACPSKGDYVLMQGADFAQPADFSGWQVEGCPYRTTFKVRGGVFRLTVAGGVVVIFR